VTPRGGAPFVPPVALYVHVPVCASKCSYCDFYSLPFTALPEGLEDGLVVATLDRARLLAERFGVRAIETVYIGGGTPTMLSHRALDRLLRGIAEILDAGSIAIMAMRGVTRLSLGVQSLDVDELKLLGRKHGPDEALEAVRLAASSGMNVSADLIAGIPVPRRNAGEPLRRHARNGLSSYALSLLDAGASHLSAYDLTLEEGTPLASRSDLGYPTEDQVWEERRLLEKALMGRGLRRYEVSNYSARGRECRHNLHYWRMDSYIGAGPGAVSTIARADGSSLRIEEPKDIMAYAQTADLAIETRIGTRDSAFEMIMMSFRTAFGLDLETFYDRFGLRAEALIGETLSAWSSHIVAGETWPREADTESLRAKSDSDSSGGPAMDGAGLDILNRFLCDCLVEIDRSFPV